MTPERSGRRPYPGAGPFREDRHPAGHRERPVSDRNIRRFGLAPLDTERARVAAPGHRKEAAFSIDAFPRGTGSRTAGKHAPVSFGALNTWYDAYAPTTARPRLEAARRHRDAA